MAKKQEIEEQPQTVEDYLLSQLDKPAMAKNKKTGEFEEVKSPEDGHVMTKNELIATTILNNAMKGDLKSATYIQNLQQRASIMKKNK